jgi:IS1 family transposase
MSRLTLSRKKHIRHPNFLQKNQKVIGFGLIFVGIGELILTCYLMFFIPDAFISPIPLSFQGKAPVMDDSTITALKKLLTKHEISYKQIYTTKEGDYLITLNPEGEVLVGKNATLEQHISSLQLVLARITMEGKQFSRLDFRFEKPVIVFK